MAHFNPLGIAPPPPGWRSPSARRDTEPPTGIATAAHKPAPTHKGRSGTPPLDGIIPSRYCRRNKKEKMGKLAKKGTAHGLSYTDPTSGVKYQGWLAGVPTVLHHPCGSGVMPALLVSEIFPICRTPLPVFSETGECLSLWRPGKIVSDIQERLLTGELKARP